MGYYTIRLDPKAVEMFTIIFPWGKYSYLRLPTLSRHLPFQAEMMNLMEAQKYVRAYINDLLVITKGALEDHLGCDFFEHRGEKHIDIGTLLVFHFFLFKMASYVFASFFLCFFWRWSICSYACAHMDV